MEIKKIKNFRDLSYLNNDDIKIKNGFLIRSGHLHKLSIKGSNQLKNKYNISTIIDLRSTQEIKEKPDINTDKFNYINIPIFDLSVYGVTREHKSIKDALFKEKSITQILDSIPDMASIYKNIIKEEESRNNIKKIINTILDNIINNDGILFHCTVGKDRTGIITVILLKILGFSDDIIIKDYLLTNIYAKKEERKVYLGILLFKRNRKLARIISSMMLAKEEFIKGFIESINELYGDFNNFITKGLEIDTNKILKFKSTLIA